MIIHEIQIAFNENPTVDVRGVFLDITKTFDKVWHDGLLYKWKTCGVQSDLLSLLKNCFQNGEQKEAATRGILKSLPKNFTNFTGKNLYQSLIFNKAAGLRPATLLKRDSGTGVFLWILQNF